MKYFVVDAFTDRPFGGNPAGVVLLDADTFPSEALMCRIAAELRYSETAFIRRHSAQEFTLRYFTPKAEVELCGHATIASFYLLHRQGLAAGLCRCHTLAGDLDIEAGERVMMQMALPRIVATIADSREIYEALGVSGYQPALPVQVVSTGLPDLMIPLPDVATLQSLQPDMAAVEAITRRLAVVSFHPFAFANDDYTAHVRDFAPLYGIPEESATGTANAALTHYLQQCGLLDAGAEASFIQGEAMGRPSVVATRIRPDGRIFVGGTAVVVAEGSLLDEQYARINPMSEAFDRLSRLSAVPTAEDVECLREYMDSGQWMRDFEADERGEVGPEVNRSVLSEDGLYNLLRDLDDAAGD